MTPPSRRGGEIGARLDRIGEYLSRGGANPAYWRVVSESTGWDAWFYIPGRIMKWDAGACRMVVDTETDMEVGDRMITRRHETRDEALETLEDFAVSMLTEGKA